jgi:hypothetical protein
MKKTFEDDREQSGRWRTPHYLNLPGFGLRAYESLRARQLLRGSMKLLKKLAFYKRVILSRPEYYLGAVFH